MNQDLRSFLKDAGYLDSPAERLIWNGASPSLRGYLRLLCKLALLGGLPLGVLAASQSSLRRSDNIILCALYTLIVALFLVCLDGVFAILLRIGKLERSASSALWVYGLPVLATALLFGSGLQLFGAASGALAAQLLLIATLLLVAGLLATLPRFLWINRLYWYGLRPPNHRATWGLMLAASASAALFHFVTEKPDSGMPILTPKPRPGLVLLGFDIPEEQFATYLAALPDWTPVPLRAEPGSVTDFWAGIGTGTPNAAHRASLLFYRSPLFKGELSAADPSLRLPLTLLRSLGLTEPLAGNGRYRKYAWEILQDYGLECYALGYWFSFPAHCQTGGILSERWLPGRDGPPFQCGLEKRFPQQRLDLGLTGAARALEDRENQIWAQLAQPIAARPFALASAYFPLSDNLETIPPERRDQLHTQIATFRGQRFAALSQLFAQPLPVGIVLASGKSLGKDRKVLFLGNPSWRQNVTPIPETQLALAPTILNYFGLPADYLMYKRSDAPSPKPLVAVDYGEPYRPEASNDQLDTRYYQELKALGYIQ